jgi:transposase
MVVESMSTEASSLPDDPQALKALVLQLQGSLRAHDLLVQALRLQIARLKRQKFGASSEKIAREIEQLELALEGLQIAQAEVAPAPEPATVDIAPDTESSEERAKAPRRRPRVSPDTPRERREMDPGDACPDCGGVLRLVGEDVSQILDMIAAQMKVIEVARLKKSCRCCEKMVQCPAPSRPIPGSLAGPSLLAFILVSKYDDHLPLYRLNEIFARMGTDIPDSTLSGWCGGAMKTLTPLVDLLRANVMACDLLHADDTPIRVLDRAKAAGELGKGIKEGRIWAYVRDQRPWSGTAPPGVAYYFSPDRKGEHPRKHLKNSKGILQADAYSGFRDLYQLGLDGTAQFREAACWAHLRRDFHDFWKSTQSDIAREALDRIGALYDIEAQISGKSAAERLAVRQAHSRPKVEAFKLWADDHLRHISGKGDLAKAFRYALNRWPSFCRFLEDGRVAIDNNPAERAMRPIGIGRKNWLFAGNDAGGETLAKAMTLIESAKLSGLNPQAYLADVLARISDHIAPRLYELLPWNWKPLHADAADKITA